MAREQEKRPTARQVARSLKGVSGRLGVVVAQLERAGDVPLSAESAAALDAIVGVMRRAVEPTPAAGAAEKGRSESALWPRDMAASSSAALTWGRDPEVLRHG